jgi:hypothetical protein
LPNANPTATVCRGERRPVSLPLLPLPRAGFLDPAQAGRLAKRGRELLRAGEITHRELALLDCLLWSCRRPGQDLAVASYTALCKLAHVAKDTVAAGLSKLEGLGLIQRIKRRVRMSWHQGGSRSLQATSCYRLVPSPVSDAKPAAAPHSESGGRTVNKGMEVFYQERTASDDGEAAKKALQEIAAARAMRFQQEWAARHAKRWGRDSDSRP